MLLSGITYDSFCCSSFTGHEHLWSFGLINMNGRMYDPVMSSFLSPDNYMQDPTSQQGFNRYAYCMYNPLKYVDPTGEQYTGWDPSLINRMEQEARQQVLKAWEHLYEVAMASHILTMKMASCLFSDGLYTPAGGSGNHGSGGGGGCKAKAKFNGFQLNKHVNITEGICVITSLGSMNRCFKPYGDNTEAWEERAMAYKNEFHKNPFTEDNFSEFINWNPDPNKYSDYECERIEFSEICDAMNNGYVVSAACVFSDEMVDYYGFKNKGHFVNVDFIRIKNDGRIRISFNDNPSNNFMHDYRSNQSISFDRFIYNEYNHNKGDIIHILNRINFYKIRLVP